MKKLLVLASLMLMSVLGMAQTKQGVYVITTVGVTDVRTDLNGRLGAEVGYFGKTLGLTGTVESNTRLNSEALVGVKGYVNVVTVSNLVVKGAFGASTYAKDLKDSQWRFAPEVSVNAPLFPNLDARIATQGYLYSHDNWKVYPGVSFGLAGKF